MLGRNAETSPLRSRRRRLVAWAVAGLLGVALLLSAGGPSQAAVAAAADCAPSVTVACPIRFGEPVSARLTDPLDLHAWHLHVLGQADIRVVLSQLPADFGARIVGPEGTVLAEQRRGGTADEVVEVPWTGAGVYAIFVNSLRGETSDRPYSLLVTGTPAVDVPPALDGSWQVLVSGRGDKPGQLNEPRGLVVDELGNLSVAESTNHRIQFFSGTGASLGVRGRRGVEPGQFKNPAGLARDGSGFLYVADRLNNRVQKLSPAGDSVAAWGSEGTEPGQFRVPIGVALDAAGNVYVVDRFNFRVQKLSPAGQPLAVWGSRGPGPGQFDSQTDSDGPVGIALDGQGNVYVADTGNHRIQKLSPSGEPLAVWGVKGRDPGEFNWPVGVVVDGQGSIYVADAGNARVQKLSPAGQPMAIWGGRGSGPGLFTNPQHVTLDSQGYVYVSDAESHRIHRFVPSQQ